MLAKTIMIQGTSSSVGKSLLVAGLCRIFRNAGFRTAPFKSQNMALNSAVTPDGFEISRSQTMQAEAAGIAPTVEMNPILLKPKGDMRAQVVLRGKPYGDYGAREYREQVTPLALTVAIECLIELRKTHDIIVIEGAGSPSEINLKDHDIANMKIAEIAEAPVLLVGDIDRGGCLAALVGTLELLTSEERARVKGLIINKFRGDLSLLTSGLDFLTEKTGIPVLGVLPYLQLELPEEDSQGLRDYPREYRELFDKQLIRVGVIKLPRISNFTDFDALAAEPEVELRFITNPDELDICDWVIIPGTKNTTADLQWLHETGFAAKIITLASKVVIMGICGGYQMLGAEIADPLHLESDLGQVKGLNLLPIHTEFKTTAKITRQVTGIWNNANGQSIRISGYEIHQGISGFTGQANLFQLDSGGYEGYQLDNIFGTYLHGCLDNDDFRWEILDRICRARQMESPNHRRSYKAVREESYRKLADIMSQNLNISAILGVTGVSL